MQNKRTLANLSRNASGQIVESGQKCRAEFLLAHKIPQYGASAHKRCLLHIHDLEYYDTTYNCIGIMVQDMIGSKETNFSGMLRRLERGIVELTNRQSGGIGFINFDSDAAEYITWEADDDIRECLWEFLLDMNASTRKGCEKPYVTLNFGLGTNPNATRVTRLLLEAYLQGDDAGMPFVFPNLVFKIKRGVNRNPEDQNYKLFQLALQTTGQRMIPTYFNCDSVSNHEYPPEKIGIMGCRTRVVANRHGEATSIHRGNIACVTLNLVQIAFEAEHSLENFLKHLWETMEISRKLLLDRFDVLCKIWNNEDCFDESIYMGHESRSAEMIFRNGTLSIGFIGLWDALSTLYGVNFKSADELEAYKKCAVDIVRQMRTFVDQASAEENKNFSLLASAAEGVTGRFAEHDRKYFCNKLMAAEKGYYTNSFHVPVDIQIDYKKKIAMEAPFHVLCSGGSITYVEFAETPGKNVEAVEDVIMDAYEHDCGYMGINFRMDTCRSCGFTGRIADCCPKCGSREIRKLRRVSGYLADEDTFTKGKTCELNRRIEHM